MSWVYICVAILSILLFYAINRPEGYDMYHSGGHLKWIPYFLFMILGAHLGKLTKEDVACGKESIERNVFKDGFMAIICIIAFYAIYITKKYDTLADLQVYNFIPLFWGVYYLYYFAESSVMRGFCRRHYFLIRLVGGLCLEIYLVQRYIITDRINNLFPLNLMIILCHIIFCAYFVRCLARLLGQTFKDGSYNWKEIVQLY